MIDEDIINLNEKRAFLQRFWQNTVKKYYKDLICDVDAMDIDKPQAIAEFAQDILLHMLRTEK